MNKHNPCDEIRERNHLKQTTEKSITKCRSNCRKLFRTLIRMQGKNTSQKQEGIKRKFIESKTIA